MRTQQATFLLLNSSINQLISHLLLRYCCAARLVLLVSTTRAKR
ncbi:hypothetical protein [Prevotella sp.]